MKTNKEKINKALKCLNWSALEEVLEALLLTENDRQIILKAVLKSESMVRRRPNDDGLKRNQLLQALEQFFCQKEQKEAAETVLELQRMFHSIDKGYVAIYSVESKLPFSQLSPALRVSAIFTYLDTVGKELRSDYERAFQEAGVISANLQVKDAAGISYNPNATYHGLTLAASDALQSEGYRHTYFDAPGELVLPALVPVSDTEQNAVQGKLINASLWRRWKTIDERHRLLNADLREFSVPNLPEWLTNFQGYENIEIAFEFQDCSELERLDTIATERFDARMQQTFHQMLVNTNLLENVAPATAKKIPLPPAGLVSMDEAHAVVMLSQFLGLRLDKTKAGSILLSDRLRGYAVLKQLVLRELDSQGTHFPLFSHADLQAEFIRCGMTSVAADVFVKAATFNRSSRDMYDQPLIRFSDGRYMLFGFSLVGANLVKVMISSLENARISFQKKGPAFELNIISLLKAQNFDARKLNVWRGPNKEERFDYDVTFVWGDYVFFIECKNRSIPFGNTIAMANFADELSDHADQVERLRQGLVEYPDIITSDYPEAIGKKPIFCVVFSLPFCQGLQNGIYYIDESILGRFFSHGGTFGMELGPLNFDEPRCRFEIARFWEGEKPSPEDFLRYMQNPPQLKLSAAHYELRASLFRLSENVALWYADWTRKHLSDSEVAKILTEATKVDATAAQHVDSAV